MIVLLFWTARRARFPIVSSTKSSRDDFLCGAVVHVRTCRRFSRECMPLDRGDVLCVPLRTGERAAVAPQTRCVA
jgi:hypothetical protein